MINHKPYPKPDGREFKCNLKKKRQVEVVDEVERFNIRFMKEINLGRTVLDAILLALTFTFTNYHVKLL